MMRCPSCAAEINSNSVFCLNCGAKLPTPKPDDAPAYAAPAYTPPAPPAPQAAPTTPQAPPEPQAPAGEAAPAYTPPQNNTSAAGVTYTAPAYTPPAYNEPPKSNYGGGNAGGNFGGGGYGGGYGGGAPQQPASKPVFFGERTSPVISTKNWLGTLLLMMLIPVAMAIIAGFIGGLLGSDNIITSIIEIIAGLSGLIFVFIMAFNRRVNPSKRNFFRAVLWFTLIMLVITTIVIVLLFTVFSAFLGSLGGLGEITELLEQLGGMDLGQFV